VSRQPAISRETADNQNTSGEGSTEMGNSEAADNEEGPEYDSAGTRSPHGGRPERWSTGLERAAEMQQGGRRGWRMRAHPERPALSKLIADDEGLAIEFEPAELVRATHGSDIRPTQRRTSPAQQHADVGPANEEVADFERNDLLVRIELVYHPHPIEPASRRCFNHAASCRP
jgi:hypothetical protein